jgi:hypothetical protein
LEDLIKDLLESPEHFGKSHFATKLIFSASKTDGKELRRNIVLWLDDKYFKDDIKEEGEGNSNTDSITEEDLKIIEVKEKTATKSIDKLFDELQSKDTDGATTE